VKLRPLYLHRIYATTSIPRLQCLYYVNCGPRVAAAVPGDVHDMEHRAATRAGLALSLHAWGCRVSPANWDWSHLRVQLETALKHPHVRYLGDAWMLAVLVMLDATTCSDGDAASNAAARDDKWWWTSALHHGDPLSPNASHWEAPSSPLLSALGIQTSYALSSAGYVACGHFCCNAEGGGTRWLTFGEAIKRDRDLPRSSACRKAWLQTAAELDAKFIPCAVEKPDGALRVWRQTSTINFSPPAGAAASAHSCLPNTAALMRLGDDLQLARRQGSVCSLLR
jgi:hypothetical protein